MGTQALENIEEEEGTSERFVFRFSFFVLILW